MAAYAPGTWRNKFNQMKRYRNFVKKYNLSILKPTNFQVMAYAAYLYNKYHVPGTVYNYISGAKSWVKLKGGNIQAFDDYYMQLVKKGVSRVACHNTRQAIPLTISHIKKIIKVFNNIGKNAYVFTAVTLISYLSLLRQSNLAISGLEGSLSHVVKQKDIEVVHHNLHITVRSTKTSWQPCDQYVVIIPSNPGSRYCPVQAWKRYYEIAPKNPQLPAFWVKGGSPLTSKTWLGAVRLALRYVGVPSPNAYTLHSIRRGAAQECISRGLDEQLVREAGRWRSDAMYRYIPKTKVKAVPSALVKFFGRAPL